MQFDQPMIKSCFELIQKTNKLIEKTVERETGNAIVALRELKENPPSKEKAAETTARLTTSLHRLREELDRSTQLQMEHLHRMRDRLHHAQQSNTTNPINEQRLDRMIVDFMLRQGFYETALRLSSDSGIDRFVDAEIFLAAREVEADLDNRSCVAALRWCAENKSKLRKMKSDFEFKLRLQEFICLLGEGKAQEAITHARKHLTVVEEPHASQVMQAMGLLAFYNIPTSATTKKFLDGGRWEELKGEFRKCNLMIHSLTSEPLLNVCVHAGLVALKTPQCHQGDTNKDCPVCFSPLTRLAEGLPWAQQRSRLVCRISGQLMNENNPPMVLPNGRVYSAEAMDAMAAMNKGMVRCPVTLREYRYSELRKAFIT